MRRRVITKSSTRVDDLPRVEVVLVEGASRMMTLEEVGEVPQEAQDAFVRLRPPEGTTPDETSSWAILARKRAKAVRVLPVPRSAVVPIEVARADGAPVLGIREEAIAIAEESGDSELLALVQRVLGELR